MTKFTEHMRRRLQDVPGRLCVMLLTLCSLSLTVFALFSSLNVVYVSDSYGESRMVITRSEDPKKLMDLSGIVAGQDDAVYYTAYSGNLASLSIQRAQPITILADGATHIAQMVGGTVEDALAECGIQLGEHDYTEPSLHSGVDPETSITVHRVEYRDTVVQESIPFETEYVYTSLYYRNKRRTTTLQQGQEGIREITHRERIVDGELESSQVIGTAVTREPRNTIIKAYKAGAPVSNLEGPAVVNGVPSSYSAVYTGRASGYSSKGGRGASRMGLRYGTVAVNPNLIPYGTKLYIASTDGKFVYGYAIATDTGGALMNGSVLVDLYYETYAEALMNGVQQVNVYVVG